MYVARSQYFLLAEKFKSLYGKRFRIIGTRYNIKHKITQYYLGKNNSSKERAVLPLAFWLTAPFEFGTTL